MMTCFLRDTRAAAAAEMALMLPLLIMLMLGVAEGSYMIWSEHVVVKAVREGARYASHQSWANLNCSSQDTTTVNNIKLLTRTGQINSSTAASRIRNWTDSGVTVSVACNTNSNVAAGIYTGLSGGAPVVTVSANTAYPSLFKRFGLTKAAISINLKAQDSAPVIGI